LSIFEIKSSVVYGKRIFSHGAKLFTNGQKLAELMGKYDEVKRGREKNYKFPAKKNAYAIMLLPQSPS
jgi:hypothetical protein